MQEYRILLTRLAAQAMRTRARLKAVALAAKVAFIALAVLPAHSASAQVRLTEVTTEVDGDVFYVRGYVATDAPPGPLQYADLITFETNNGRPNQKLAALTSTYGSTGSCGVGYSRKLLSGCSYTARVRIYEPGSSTASSQEAFVALLEQGGWRLLGDMTVQGVVPEAPGDAEAKAEACQGILRAIEGAKQTWALHNEIRPNSLNTPSQNDLKKYLSRDVMWGGTNFPVCWCGGAYTIGPMNAKPTCSKAAEGHVLR